MAKMTWGGRRPGAGRKMGEELVRLSIALPPSVAASLAAEAGRRGMSVAALVRELVEAAAVPTPLSWADL